MGEAKQQVFGLWQGIRKGMPAALEALKTNEMQPLPGETPSDLFDNRPALRQTGAISGRNVELLTGRALPPGVSRAVDLAGSVIRAPGRPIQAVHALTRWLAYSQELHSLAYRDAASRGLEGTELETAITKTLADPPVAMMTQASETATDMALMKTHAFGSSTNAIARLANSSLLGKIVLPFVNIVTNVLHQGLMERSVLGLLSQDVRDNLLGRNGAVARDQQASRLMAGSMISGAVASLAAEGMMTGAGPSDPNERRLWLQAGNQPYSVRIGDRWIYYRGGPIGELMAVTADIVEIARDARDEDLAHVVGAVVSGVGKSVTDASWLRSVAGLMGAIERPETRGASFIGQLAANFAVPFSVGMGQVARATDPYLRDARTILDTIRTRVPGLSLTVAPKRDLWGEPIERHALLSPSGPTRANADPLAAELLRLGVTPPPVKRQIRGIDLTDQQYDDYARVAGRLARIQVGSLVAHPGWNTLPDGVRREVLSKVITGARRQAQTGVMMQSVGSGNDIVRQAVEAKRAALE